MARRKFAEIVRAKNNWVENSTFTAPSDVLGDDIARIKGIIGTMSGLCSSEGEPIATENLVWTLIVLEQLITDLEDDLKEVDNHWMRLKRFGPKAVEAHKKGAWS